MSTSQGIKKTFEELCMYIKMLECPSSIWYDEKLRLLELYFNNIILSHQASLVFREISSAILTYDKRKL